MLKDIRMNEVSYEKVEGFLNRLADQPVYVKLINTTSDIDNKSQQVGMYRSINVRNVETAYSQIILYGRNDEDKLFFDKGNIVSCQMTEEEDEVLFILENHNVSSTIYIKKYLPRMNDRFDRILYSQRNTIITEGKSDWKHLKNALMKFRSNGKYEDLDFSFIEYECTMGCDALLKVCEYLSLFENRYLKVFVLDSDRPDINRKYMTGRFKYHGNNVYSMLLPIPDFRKNTPLISIENYYEDDVIVRADKNGRRLFLNGEFDNNGILKTDNRVKDMKHSKHKNMGTNYVIDEKVIQCECPISEISKDELFKRGKNIALSKNAFADNILSGEPPFDSVNYDTFSLVFDVIKEIQDSKATHIYEDLKKHCIQEDIIEQAIKLYRFQNEMYVLTLDIEMPDFLKGRGRISDVVAVGIRYKDEQFIISLSYYESSGEKTIEIPLPCSYSIISFLKEKMNNQYNRIELFMHDGEIVRSLEIFSDSISGALIERALRMV